MKSVGAVALLVIVCGSPAAASAPVAYSFDYHIVRTVSGISVGDYPFVGELSHTIIKTGLTGSGLISFTPMLVAEGTPTFYGTNYSGSLNLSIGVGGRTFSLLRPDTVASIHVENTPSFLSVYDLIRITGIGQNEKWQYGSVSSGFSYHPWSAEVFIGSKATAISGSDLTAENFAALTSPSFAAFEGGQGSFGIHDDFNPSATVVGIMENFREVTTVPEVSLWTMMVIGFGIIGVAARRVKSRDASAKLFSDSEA